MWGAVAVLIGGFVLGAIIVLAGSFTLVMGKILGTMAILALVLFVGVNNFIRIEKGTKAIQILALVGLISGLLAAIVGILLIWEVLPIYDYSASTCNYSKYGSTCNLMGAFTYTYPSIAAKIVAIFSSLAGAGFWLSNVMSIKETIKVVKPLKITSIVCETYCAVFAIVVALLNYQIEATNLYALSGLAGFAFVVTALAAWIISRTSGKKNAEVASVPKTDAELRAEIEEKVRREMIEKQVREQMGATQQLEQTETVAQDQNKENH